MYLLAIDPGTKMMGISVFELQSSPCGFTGKVVHSSTVNIELMAHHKHRYSIADEHGERLAKIECCKEIINSFLQAWGIRFVVSETPYMGRFPQAFGALVECMLAMKQAVLYYDNTIVFDGIDPSSVKNAVGVSGKSGDKNLMLKAVQRLVPYVDTNCLDEHAIDSIAVGITWVSRRYGGFTI